MKFQDDDDLTAVTKRDEEKVIFILFNRAPLVCLIHLKICRAFQNFQLHFELRLLG